MGGVELLERIERHLQGPIRVSGRRRETGRLGEEGGMVDTGQGLGCRDPGPQLERALGVVERLLVGMDGGERIEGSDRALQRPRQVVGVIGVDGQVGHERQVVASAGPQERVEVIGESSVGSCPLGRQELVVGRLSQKRMSKRVGRSVEHLDRNEDVRLDRLTHAGHERPGSQVDHGGQVVVGEPAADDGCRPNDRQGIGRQRCQPGTEDISQRWRDGRPALLARLGEHLDVEGQAARAFEHRVDLDRRRRPPEDPAELLLDLGAIERGQLDALDAADPPKLGEQAHQRMPALQVVGSVGRDQRDTLGGHVPDQEPDQVAGRAVRPLEVLDREHGGGVTRDPPEGAVAVRELDWRRSCG